MAIIFFPDKKKFNVTVTDHALKRIEEANLNEVVLGVLEVISDDPEFFFRHAKVDGLIHLPEHYKDWVPYIMSFKGLRFIFYYEKDNNDLLLITVYENMRKG